MSKSLPLKNGSGSGSMFNNHRISVVVSLSKYIIDITILFMMINHFTEVNLSIILMSNMSSALMRVLQDKLRVVLVHLSAHIPPSPPPPGSGTGSVQSVVGGRV